MTEREHGEPSGVQREPRIVESPQVGLPEFLRQVTAEGLLPSTVAYFSPGVLTYDEYTEKLWFDTSTPVFEGNLSLEPYTITKGGIVALMPLLDSDGSRKYVLDASGLRPGHLSIVEDFLGYKDEADDDEASNVFIKKRQENTTVAAAAFKNLDGDIEFHGNATYFDALHYLVDTYDTQLKENADKQNFKFVSDNLLGMDPSVTDDEGDADESSEVTTETDATDTPITSEPPVELIYRIPVDPSA